MTIAVLGGYGDVGKGTCQYLLSLGLGPIRIGGRHAETSRVIADPQVSYQNADYTDEASLLAFIQDCRLLINCAGPSYLIGDRLARVAKEHKLPYVDVAGDDALYQTLAKSDYQDGGDIALLSAGLQPGLTGLLPLWLAQQTSFEVRHLTCYFVLFDRFTAVAADDYMQGVEEALSSPLAAWRNGHITHSVLQRQQGLSLPFVPTEVTVLPQISTENVRLAKQLSLSSAQWYNCVIGEHILNAFNTVQSQTRRQAIASLCHASALDMAGRTPSIWLLLEGQDQYKQHSYTTIVKGTGNADLTGAIAALSAAAVLQGDIPPGLHYCPQALPAAHLFPALQNLGAVHTLNCFDMSLEQLLEPEQGEI